MKTKITVLIICILISGLTNCILGPDGNWDFYAYHYYNGYAALHGRVGYDIMPAGIQSYFNPLLDIINYLIINTFRQYQYVVTFLQGISWGLLSFVLYLISDLLFSKVTEDRLINNALIFFATIVGATECIIVSEIGTSLNDITIAILILLSLYYLLKFAQKQKNKYIVYSGVIVGIACGLKLTSSIYIIPLVISFCLLNIKNGLKNILKDIFIYMIFVLLGFLIIDGYWMLLIYKNFGNPFFPMFNDIFKSKYYAFVNYEDYRLNNINIFKIFLYPIFWSIKNYVCEHYFFDFRHSFAYFSCIYSLIIVIKNRLKTFVFNIYDINLSILVFSVFSYLLWIKATPVVRYFIPILALTGVLISIFILNIKFLYSSRRNVILTILSLIFIFNIKYTTPNWGRLDSILEVPKLPIEENSVVFLYGKPAGYFAARQYKKVRFILLLGGNDGESSDFIPSELYFEKVDSLVKNKKKYIIMRVRRKNFERTKDEDYRKMIKNRYINAKLKCTKIRDITQNTDRYTRAENFDFCEYME